MTAAGGHRRVRAALGKFLAGDDALSALTATDAFGGELDGYAEIIVGPRGNPIGFMTRGETPGFTARAQAVLGQLGMPREALARHDLLARRFEHLRAFLKLEWHRPDGSGDAAAPLAACYFRRRPEVATLLSWLRDDGVAPHVLERVVAIARTVEKDSVHFVSAAFRTGSEVHHKLYFSQYASEDRRAAVAARIGRVFDVYGIGDPVRSLWRARHDATVARGDTTIYVSISFTADRITPDFKIDYPDVPTREVAEWAEPARHPDVLADVGLACELAGVRRLSFLGVRFAVDRPWPSLKYYADVPTSPR